MFHRQLNPKVSVSIVFVVALFMSIMDTTIVNVALPSIARQLGVSPDSLDAIVVGYMVSLAVVIPVSGWLGDRCGTKRIFLLALALFSFFFLQEEREPGSDHFDLAGFILAGSGLALTMYALTEGPSYGWTSIRILGGLIGGLLLLGVFAMVEVRVQEPMLDLRLFSNRLFRSANLVTLFSSAGFLGVLYA